MTLTRKSTYISFSRLVSTLGVSALLVAAFVVITGCGLSGGGSDSEDVVFSVDVEGNIGV
jgi:hypothetical protein